MKPHNREKLLRLLELILEGIVAGCTSEFVRIVWELIQMGLS